MGLLGEQHAGGWQLQAGQDLLPQFAQVGFIPGSSVCFGAGFWGGFWALHCLGGWGSSNDWRRNGWLGRRRSGCGLELGLCQEAEQQDFEPQPGIDAVAQLLLAALELGLPVQQLRFADAAGQLW